MHYIIIVLLIIIRGEGIASCLLTATIMDHSLIASALPWWYSKYNIDYGPQYIHHFQTLSKWEHYSLNFSIFPDKDIFEGLFLLFSERLKRGGAKSGFFDKGGPVTQSPMDQMT